MAPSPVNTGQLTMRMHRDARGNCWADSEQLPQYSVAGASFGAVMHLVREGLESSVHGSALLPLIDIRWQWCDDPARGIRALSVDSEPIDIVTGLGAVQAPAPVHRHPCPCEAREIRPTRPRRMTA